MGIIGKTGVVTSSCPRKRDGNTGQFMVGKKDGTLFKGVRKNPAKDIRSATEGRSMATPL